jgi:hypothetical protein
MLMSSTVDVLRGVDAADHPPTFTNIADDSACCPDDA